MKKTNKVNSNLKSKKKKFDRSSDKESKRAQQILGIGFGVMFSIILIVFIVATAVYVIYTFVDAQKCAQIGLFIGAIQDKVKDVWDAPSGTNTFKRALPTKIDYLCIVDFTKDRYGEFEDLGFKIWVYKNHKTNAVFYPNNKACQTPDFKIDHLDLDYITSKNNPQCFKINDGEIELDIEKKLNENKVIIK